MPRQKAIGCSFEDAAVIGGTVDNTVIGGTTPAAATVTNFSQSGASSTTGFYNATPIAQRTAAILTATASLYAVTGTSYCAQTSATVSGLFGFNSAMMTQVIDSLTEIRNFLATIGLHKGGA